MEIKQESTEAFFLMEDDNFSKTNKLGEQAADTGVKNFDGVSSVSGTDPFAGAIDDPTLSTVTASFFDNESLPSSSIGDGEILLLIESLNEDEPKNLAAKFEASFQELNENNEFGQLNENNEFGHNIHNISDNDAPYGNPLSSEDARNAMPCGDEGRIWYATLFPNEFVVNGKICKGLNPRDIDVPSKTIKPRRASLAVTQKDFLSSITKVCEAGTIRPRYVFNGILNGWPSLRCFELIALEQRRDVSTIPSPKEILSGQLQWVKTWNAEEEGSKGKAPQSCIDPKKVYRARLRGAPWTEHGWSKSSPGFVFWYEPQRNDDNPKVLYGTNVLEGLDDKDSKCTFIHMLSHRYAKERELPRDLLTYHSICLLEWDHGKYCTVIESAYLNGMGGYRGRSNWYDDKDVEPMNGLYSTLPPEMISPWSSNFAEIRCYDVLAKTLDEFKQYVAKYTGNTKRFIDPQYSFSHPARLTFRSKAHIAQYLINYIMRDTNYADLKRNCQTFTADLCSFIAGKKNVQPFHPVSRIDFQNRTHLFLYEPNMYYDKKKKPSPGKKRMNQR